MEKVDKNGLKLGEMLVSSSLASWKAPMKTKFASKFIMFKECFEFMDVINLCYSWQKIALQNKIPSL
jgi:hypothetical protein